MPRIKARRVMRQVLVLTNHLNAEAAANTEAELGRVRTSVPSATSVFKIRLTPGRARTGFHVAKKRPAPRRKPAG